MNRTLLRGICTVVGTLVGAVLAVLANELFGIGGIIGLLVILIALYIGVYLAGGEEK